RTSSWEQEGQKRYRTEVVAREMQMLDGRAGGMGGGMGGDAPPTGFEPRRADPRPDNRPTLDEDPGFDDDDIPF
ncbi:MAG: hypothetical protein ACO3P1_09350, partial [Pseudomonadales bacterium]